MLPGTHLFLALLVVVVSKETCTKRGDTQSETATDLHGFMFRHCCSATAGTTYLELLLALLVEVVPVLLLLLVGNVHLLVLVLIPVRAALLVLEGRLLLRVAGLLVGLLRGLFVRGLVASAAVRRGLLLLAAIVLLLGAGPQSRCHGRGPVSLCVVVS